MFSVLRHHGAILLPVLLMVIGLSTLLAQEGPAGAQQTRAQQLPISGRQVEQSGSVSAQQSTVGGTGTSVNVSTTNIQVRGNYQGSVPAGEQPVTGGAITLEQTLKMGLQYNLGTVSSSASLRQVRGQRLSALSQLLPTVNAIASETGAKTDLETIGLSSSSFGGGKPLPGFSIPVTVGPYHYYDARASLNFNALDLTALHNYRSAKEVERAAELSDVDARELVVLAVGGEYLRVLADEALVEAQVAQVRYAQSSYDQAVAQNQAGTKSDVDTKRSQVELQTEQQRLTSQRADLVKEKRTLARMIGLHLDADIVPVEKLTFTPVPPLPIEAALMQALSSRADLKSAAAQLRASEEALKAAHSERLPMINVNGYLAVEGVNPNAGNGVFSATASVNIPIFEGGRIKADEQQARAAIDQRRAEYQDQEGVVELEVRNAYTDLQTAANQVQVAESNRTLALETLQQSQDRFVAGVATSVEVVQSQESLAAADRDYVSSLYAHNLTKIALARAIGQAETSIPQFLKGQ
ncbi:MAG: TolC family protein [Bryobacterales bacterium]|nr:TolC family protein [Bryobacterales bacterium]